MYDTFGNNRAHTPTAYPFVKPGQGTQDQEPLVVELPPPLPKKPSSFKSRGERQSNSEAPPVLSPKKRNKPLPPRPDLNEQDTPEKSTNDQSVSDKNETKQEDHTDAAKIENGGSHYQSVDNEKPEAVNGSGHYQKIDEDKTEGNPSKIEINGSHYQSVGDQKESEYDEPRGRLNTHSSNPDLTNIPEGKGTLDRSKRTTLHRSAPSLALYSTVNKKSKGSPKLGKTGSTFKLFKRFGRSSKREEEEKIPRSSKKSQKKENRVQSTSSLKPLVTEEDGVSYVDIDGEESALAKSLMDRRDSKRPLPDLPSQSSIDM